MVARSPNYPAIDLGAALVAVDKAFKSENRNKMSQIVLANHLGYNSLNGRALGRIGAVRAYGLIEGRGDELRVSDDAITALMAPEGSGDRKGAMQRLALQPPLFKQLRADFPDSLPSEKNLTFHLVKRHYTQEAAGKAAKTFLATMRLAEGGWQGYNPQENGEMEDVTVDLPPADEATGKTAPKWVQMAKASPPKAGMLQEVFTLEEGQVTLSFPATLSQESYRDLADHMALFLRKAKRRAESSGEGDQ